MNIATYGQAYAGGFATDGESSTKRFARTFSAKPVAYQL